MLTWHFDVSSNLISLYQIYFVTNKMFLFHKIKNNQLLKSFSIGSMETLTLICYCKCILIVNFVSRNVSYVVMYILWTFCYIIVWTWQTLLIYVIHLLKWKRFHTTIVIFSFLETEQKTERNQVVELILVSIVWMEVVIF